MKDMICILCPRGCHINVNEETLEVFGNACQRGAQFGAQEIIEPERLLTTTASISNALYLRIPVRSNKSIPIKKIEECISVIKKLNLKAPIHMGEIIVKNICETEADIIASRNM